MLEFGEDRVSLLLQIGCNVRMHGRIIERDPCGLLGLKETSVLASPSRPDDVTGVFQLLEPSRHGVHPILNELGEASDGEDPFRVVLKRANLTVDPFCLEAQGVVEEDRVLDVGERAFPTVHHVTHHAPLPQSANRASPRLLQAAPRL